MRSPYSSPYVLTSLLHCFVLSRFLFAVLSRRPLESHVPTLTPSLFPPAEWRLPCRLSTRRHSIRQSSKPASRLFLPRPAPAARAAPAASSPVPHSSTMETRKYWRSFP